MPPVTTQGPGGIEIHGLALGETEIYSGESLALELGVIVPPWDGGQSIDFSFELETQVTMTMTMTMTMLTKIMVMIMFPFVQGDLVHYWRLCRVEVVEPSDDLVCLAKGKPQFKNYLNTTWSKSDDDGWRW